MRLVVVSNRVTPPVRGKAPPAGGLAVGVLAALAEHGGLWFGWSGEVVPGPVVAPPRSSSSGDVGFLLTDLSEAEHAGYYAGFANRTLWPLLHYRTDLASFRQAWWQSYRQVNQRLAQTLAPLLRPGDLVWIQDYHLMPMATELRRLGVTARLGFFLHVPFPAHQVFTVLPWHRQLAGDLVAYDALGFQTPGDLQQFTDYVLRELHGELEPPAGLRALGRRFEAIADPIGIDVAEFEELARSPEARSHNHRLRGSLRGCKVVMGVDRLDYSKGIPERLRGFEALLREHPLQRREVTMIQISAPSREDVPEYTALRAEVEQLAGAIAGRYAEPDWTPLRYINRGYPRRTLAGYFKVSRVGLVTPLRDGLNLVALEYLAAQDEADPGALVLSRFAGAASILEPAGALVVNPHDELDVAGALNRALGMSVEERRDRWRSQMVAVRRNDIVAWRQHFMTLLQGAPPSPGPGRPWLAATATPG